MEAAGTGLREERQALYVFEENKSYTKRGIELLQQNVQKCGKMPGDGDELDELF